MYRVYFLFPKDMPIDMDPFDFKGLTEYAAWLRESLGNVCLGSELGFADLAETQPIFGNYFKAVLYFDFNDRISAFDAMDKIGLLEIMDRMAAFTVKPCLFQGVYMN